MNATLFQTTLFELSITGFPRGQWKDLYRHELLSSLFPPMPAAISTPNPLRRTSTPCPWSTVTHRYSFHYGIDFICMMTLMMIDIRTVHQALHCVSTACIQRGATYALNIPVIRFVIQLQSVIVWLDIIHRPVSI
jgi:hypothetical protein